MGVGEVQSYGLALKALKGLRNIAHYNRDGVNLQSTSVNSNSQQLTHLYNMSILSNLKFNSQKPEIIQILFFFLSVFHKQVSATTYLESIFVYFQLTNYTTVV